jgi:hypothetical protein
MIPPDVKDIQGGLFDSTLTTTADPEINVINSIREDQN